MGHVIAQVTISNPTDAALKSTVEALVDTGATFTVIPMSLAAALQLPITGKRKVRTATGEIELDRSFALLEINGNSEISPLLISETLERALVGVLTLEALALTVDPTTGELKEAELLLY